MKLLEEIVNKILLGESVSRNDVEEVMDAHKRVIINYRSKGEDKNTGARVIEVYAYGLTKAGNQVIRAFQPYGDTTTKVPSWKFFLLDRITAWETTEQTFSRPADFYYKNIGKFNENGDETMSVVYKVISFNEESKDIEQQTPSSQPKTKDDVYKTDTENRMERLKQQVDNPIKLSDIKTNDAFKQLDKSSTTKTGPKTKEDVKGQEQTTKTTPKTEIYKTDTERGMERLRQQLDNPQKIDLSKFDNKRKEKTPEEKEKQLDKLRNVLKDKTMSLSDLNKKMSEPEKPKNDQLYKTDTERGMERLRQQLDNPQKIDLSKIPRR